MKSTELNTILENLHTAATNGSKSAEYLHDILNGILTDDTRTIHSGFHTPRMDKDGNPINTASYIEVINVGTAEQPIAKTIVVTDVTFAVAELPGYEPDGSSMLVYHWKELTFQDELAECPQALELGGKLYVNPLATQGRGKRGVVILYEESFFRRNHELLSRPKHYTWILSDKGIAEKADPAKIGMRINELKAELSVARADHRAAKHTQFNGLDHGAMILARDEARKKCRDASRRINKAEAELKQLLPLVEKRLLIPKAVATKVNQLYALGHTPSVATSCVLTADNTIIVKDIEVFNKLSSDLDVTKWVEIEGKVRAFKVTDGTSIMPLSLAKKMGFLKKLGLKEEPQVLQIRDNKRGLKGTLVIYDTKGRHFTVKDRWGVERPFNDDKVILFESVTKDAMLFGSAEEYFGEDGRTLRVCECSYEIGKVKLNRQFGEALFAMTAEEAKEIAARTTAKIIAPSLASFYKDEVEKMLMELKDACYAPMVWSPAFLRSVAKKVWNKLTHACAWRLEVDGMSGVVTPDIGGVLNVLSGADPQDTNSWTIMPNTVKVDVRAGLPRGTEVIARRAPYLNPDETILSIAGNSRIRGAIEVSCAPGSIIMMKLDADFDGDHISLFWNKAVVAAAKRTIAVCKAAGVTTLGFDDLEANEAAKVQDISELLTSMTELGQVGSTTVNAFILFNLIPHDIRPEEVDSRIVTIDGIDADGNRPLCRCLSRHDGFEGAVRRACEADGRASERHALQRAWQVPVQRVRERSERC